MTSKQLRIAIDGPSGAGKSTLARSLARELGLAYVDTGAMYRGVAWKSLRQGLEADEDVVAMLEDTRMELDTDPDDFRLRVDGEDVTDRLREPRVGQQASRVARIPAVRSWLVERQRALATGGAVLEGRDIGTVVLPDADVKFFVTAPERVRMQRRAAQLGREEDPEVVADVRDRDRRDSSRKASPLRAAEDAVRIDTSGESPDESLVRLLQIVRLRTVEK